MIIPFIPENLFELNNNLQPQFDGEVIIIDNIFKNYKNILDVCYNVPVEIWKNTPTSRNFKDYYDCRLIISNHDPIIEKHYARVSSLADIIAHFFNDNRDFEFKSSFNFNYFRNLKKDISPNFQHHPHYDGDYNIIFYIDPFKNGGTALYENVDLELNEHENLMFDISKLKLKKIVNSKPNRCVIFKGDTLHGGYIENHNTYYYNWRINLALFIGLT